MSDEINGSQKSTKPSNFIKEIIEDDLKTNKYEGIVHTRFPPEPNGYLHIGHAKSICLNFGLAKDYHGLCNLRFDDTNPSKEEVEYVDSIKEDIKWLGFDWGDREYYASDYFDQLYEYAINLIKKGKSYVDSLSFDEIRKHRGTPTEPGKNSPYRERSVEENLELFQKMKAGEFKDGEHVLRAKIDMSSPNMNMRDPILYRIKHESHHRTGDKWCIYPMYDWAHGQSDSIEGITHSICTLEFENHRPLYDWCIDELEIYHPQQIEFARLNLNYTVMSKRILLELVKSGIVKGWNDPRMPTISGFRRRGFTPESIRNFAERVGVAKRDGVINVSLLEHSLREDLNVKAKRVLGVLNPLKVVITNYPELHNMVYTTEKGKHYHYKEKCGNQKHRANLVKLSDAVEKFPVCKNCRGELGKIDNQIEELEAINNPEDLAMGNRKIPFSEEIFIEKDDFREIPPPKFFRLSPGKEVRLRYAYIIRCDKINTKTDTLECTYFPDTKSGTGTSNKKVKGTIHWVSADQAIDAEVRLYDRLFSVEDPGADKEKDFKEFINPDSLKILKDCKLEPSLKSMTADDRFQLERLGYFCLDKFDSKEISLVLNRIVSLRDTWAKIEKAQQTKK